MKRGWLVLSVFLGCAACGGSPEPPQDPQTSTKSGSGNPGSDPAKPSGGSDGTSTADPSKGGPAQVAPGSSDPGSGNHTSDSTNDCKALWDVVDDLGCDVAKLVCAVLEAIPVGGAQVKCDIAVPLACGIASAATAAAEAACPHP
jgi:hypothetical protein